MKSLGFCRPVGVSMFLVAITANGCAEDDRIANPEVAFRCDGDQGFVAVFEPDLDSVVLDVGGERFRLPHVPSASGAKYSDGASTFWTKGEEAFLEMPGATYANCRSASSS
jgi:putative lipoprotein